MVKLLVLLAAVMLMGSAPGQGRIRAVVQERDVAIEVIAEGRGPLIVLLPSLGRDSEEFDPIAEQLARGGFRALRPQPRGFGRSKGPLTGITLHDLARDLAMVLGHENGGPAILAGHAFGHFVAKMTAVDYPNLVRGVVLIAASQKNADPKVRAATEIATDPSRPEAERLANLRYVFFAPGNDARLWLTGFHADVRAHEIVARDATPQKEYWSAGAVPLLDIQAEYDPYRPPSSRHELIEEFGAERVTSVLIPHAAHAIIVEQPRAVSDAILAWARRLK
jgi:pimeloyl-ACP methyl ester carboxylesterase